MSKFTKGVDGAYSYFPWGFNEVMRMDRWLVGPTFIVSIPEEEVELSALVGFGTGPVAVDESWQVKLTGIISQAKNATQEVTIEGGKHEKKCTARAVENPGPDGKDYPMELAFPMFSLGKKLGVDTYRQLGIVLYGFRGDELVAVFAARYRVCDGSITIN